MSCDTIAECKGIEAHYLHSEELLAEFDKRVTAGAEVDAETRAHIAVIRLDRSVQFAALKSCVMRGAGICEDCPVRNLFPTPTPGAQ